MEHVFNGQKIYTALDADELKPGDIVVAADTPAAFQDPDRYVLGRLEEIRDGDHLHRFRLEGSNVDFGLAAKVPEEQAKQAERNEFRKWLEARDMDELYNALLDAGITERLFRTLADKMYSPSDLLYALGDKSEDLKQQILQDTDVDEYMDVGQPDDSDVRQFVLGWLQDNL